MNEQIMRCAGFGQQVDNFKNGVCAWCRKEITGFKNTLSAKEYGISGMCQGCQDNTFGCDSKEYTYDQTQESYIARMFEQGYLIFNVTSLALLTHDIDREVTKEICGDLVTTSKGGNTHLYLIEPFGQPASWAWKACIQSKNGSDPKRELHTLERRLRNEKYAELMCEVNRPETLAKLQEFEQKGFGYLVTLEKLNAK